MIPEEEKQIKIALLWELIEEWQLARDKGDDIHEPRFSFNDIEISFYDKMEEIDPSKKHENKSNNNSNSQMPKVQENKEVQQ